MSHLPDVWKTRVDRFPKQSIRSEVKVLLCIRMIRLGDSLRGVNEQGHMVGRPLGRI